MLAKIGNNTQLIRKKNRRYYMHATISVLFMFGFGLLPPIGGLSHLGMEALGIFLGVLYAWTFVDMLWPSLLSLLAVALTGYKPLAGVFQEGFGANVFIMTFFLFVLAAYFEQSGLTGFFANWFLSRKVAVGRPWVFVSLILLCSFVISIFTNNLVGMIMTWSIIYNVADTVGYKRKDKFITMLICGATISGAFSCIAVPFQMMSVIFLGALNTAMGLSVDFLTYTMVAMSFSFLAVAIYIVVCRLVIRPNVTPLLSKEDRYAYLRQEKMNKDQKMACCLLVIFLMALFLPSVLPAWPWVKMLANFGITGVACSCIVVLAVAKNKETGEFTVRVDNLIKNGVNWNVMILLIATMPMVNLLETKEAGVIDALLSFITPIVSAYSPYFCVAFIVIFLGIATQFAHNIVLGVVFIPVFCPLVEQLGVSPLVLAIALCFALQNAFATPAASTQAAIAFGNTEWVETGDVYKFMLLSTSLSMLLILVVFIPLLMVIF